MKKVDLRKELRHLYKPSAREVVLIDVPEMNFLMVDGAGGPNNSQHFQEAVQALYGVSYTLKFMIRKEKAVDYPVMALEGLWWTGDTVEFRLENKDAWKWRLMIMQPEWVTGGLAAEAVEQVGKKKELPALSRVRFAALHEGLSAQILYIGPYAEEGPTIARIHDYIRGNGYELAGKHHEIYLGDPRRTAPERLKTVLRQPVRKSR